MLTVKHRLSGWVRLWIVAAVIYALTVAAVATTTAPSRTAIHAAWAQDIFQAIETDVQRTSGKKIPAAQFRAMKDLKDKTDEQVTHQITLSARQIDTTKPNKADLAQYKVDIAVLAEKYEANLAALQTAQLMHAGRVFLLWLVPSLSLLIVGYALAWVIRGFRKQ